MKFVLRPPRLAPCVKRKTIRDKASPGPTSTPWSPFLTVDDDVAPCDLVTRQNQGLCPTDTQRGYGVM